MQRAERWGLLAARPLAVLSSATRPAVWLLSGSADVVVRVLGGDPARRREDVTEEEIRDMVAAQVTFTPKQRTIINGAFEIAERSLQQVLRPRREVVVLDAEDSRSATIAKLIASGHSRAPVARHGDLDELVGVAHLRDLIAEGDNEVIDRAAPPMYLPESATVLDAAGASGMDRPPLRAVNVTVGCVAGGDPDDEVAEEAFAQRSSVLPKPAAVLAATNSVALNRSSSGWSRKVRYDQRSSGWRVTS